MYLSSNETKASGLSRKTYLGIVISLFIVQLLVLIVLGYKARPWLTGDSARYLALAESLQNGRFGLATDIGIEPEGIRLPGYPLFILICQKLFNGRTAGVVVTQGALYLISVWMAWQVTTTVFSRRAGIVLLVILAFYPSIAYSSCQVSPEMPCVFLITFSAFILIRFRLKLVNFIVAGVLLGLSAYVRPNLFPLSIILTAVLIFYHRRMWRAAVALTIVPSLMLSFWAIRNYRTFGLLTPTTVHSGLGLSLFLASWRANVSTASLVQYGMYGKADPELEGSGMLEQVHGVNLRIGVDRDLPPTNMGAYPNNEKRALADKAFKEVAIENIKVRPFAYTLSTLTNVVRLWFSTHLPETIPVIIRLALVISGMLVWIAGILGIVQGLRSSVENEKRFALVAAGTVLYFSFSLCWLHTEARYTIPARLILLSAAASFMANAVQRASAAVGSR